MATAAGLVQDSPPAIRRPARSRVLNELRGIVALTLAVILVWCWAVDKWTWASLSIPASGYSGDDLFIFAIIKAARDGDISFFGDKEVKQLGAPFIANWNDYPWSEDGYYWAAGVLARAVGVFAAANIFFALAAVAAALSMYIVCRYLRYRWPWAFTAGLLYGCSYFLFQRQLAHFNIIFYWHVPLCLLTSWWVVSAKGLPLRGRRLAVALFTAIAAGFDNPYYFCYFLELLCLGMAVDFWRRRLARRLIGPAVIGGFCMLCFLATQLDTLSFGLRHGFNHGAVTRSFVDLEAYALRPIDLFLPFQHRIKWLQSIARTYAGATLLNGEFPTTYLGIIGCVCLAALLLGFFLPARGRELPMEAAGLRRQALWFILFCVPGGLNSVLGIAGIFVLRANSRVSIVLLALAMIFGVRWMTRISRHWPGRLRVLVAVVICIIGLSDQVPIQGAYLAKEDAVKMKEDRALVAEAEAHLPDNAMIFQWPTVGSPDERTATGLESYQFYRPYLYSSRLHFSFGSNKGRGDLEWTQALAAMPAPQLVAALEKYGFAALLVHRDQMLDHGDSLVQALQEIDSNAGFDSAEHSYYLFHLHPLAEPQSPWEMFSGWHGRETSPKDIWHWARGDAEIRFNHSANDGLARLRFDLNTLRPRELEILLNGKRIWRATLRGGERVPVLLEHLPLVEGENWLHFHTDKPAAPPGAGDPRLMSFCLLNFNPEYNH